MTLIHVNLIQDYVTEGEPFSIFHPVLIRRHFSAKQPFSSRLSTVFGKVILFLSKANKSNDFHLSGQGIGKLLMTETENFARQFGYKLAYLSTHDQQIFYERCGYTSCPSIVVIGANSKLLDGAQFAAFKEKLQNQGVFRHSLCFLFE